MRPPPQGPTLTTVAHLSDVHALSLDGVSPLAFLNKRAAGGLNLLLHRRHQHSLPLFAALIEDLNRVRPDHVVVSGDLTALSLDPEFALARSMLERLELPPSAVTVVPGNHDVYVWAAWLRRAFARGLGPFARSDDGDAYPLVRIRGRLAVIGLCTALPSPVPLADGWLGSRQLARLEAALTAHAGRFRLLVLHHPPVDNRWSILRALRDRRALQRLLARCGAELVVHGHEHRDLRTTLPGPAGPIPVIGVGSATYDDPRPERRARYNLYRLDGPTVAVETRVHDQGRGRFVAAADLGTARR